jgi:sugar phosphate isomerase/epimerase
MGLQLYTVRDPMAKAPLLALKQIAALGYRNLETYGFDADRVSYYGMTAGEFRRVLDDLGLRPTSGHYDLFKYLEAPEAEMRGYVDRCIEGARALGQRQS